VPQHSFINAHHSPIGAFASFTLGFPGASGGFDLERGRPPNESVFIGLAAQDGEHFDMLPFYGMAGGASEAARYTQLEAHADHGNDLLRHMQPDQIQRQLCIGTDTWTAGNLQFTLYTPSGSVPNPATASTAALQDAIVPAIWAELRIDNREGTKPRRAIFGFAGADPYNAMRHVQGEHGLVGIGQGQNVAITTRDAGVFSGIGFDPAYILKDQHTENRSWGLGGTALLVMDAPAGQVSTYRFALSFYKAGPVTANLPSTYYYTRFFKSIEAVAQYAHDHFDAKVAASRAADAQLASSKLSADQQFMLAHAVHSYFGNTQLLDHEGQALWVVNEGEYRMMNTFDLTVDQLFFELDKNPWTVKNVLDLYLQRYSYEDTVFFPGDATLHPGGISFTHDMGVANVFSPPGLSSYERAGITGCFSYMTHEQLVNWVLCAAAYVHHTQDKVWLQANLPVLQRCLQSLLQRDHPDATQRNGIMALDSSRTKGGAEITTYDSLDASLGQSRNNVYLAGKTWASYVVLADVFSRNGLSTEANSAQQQAERSARTQTALLNAEGYIPAVFEDGNASRIIPAIEGLIFPFVSGCASAVSETGAYGDYIRALKTHFKAVLQPGVCLFDDGGWKLSSTSDNSWLSKIYLCQFIAREILDLPDGDTGRRADAAHVAWLTHPELSYWSWSDQIIAGKIKGSKYYPRGVTSILWLQEAQPQ
jgi:xylan 1,4-beta-xylosidase